MTTTKRKRRIMRAFKLNEISAVDVPAQAGARAVIMKRDGDAGDELDELLKCASLITSPFEGHGHILAVADPAGALLTGGMTAPSGRDRHVHPWIVSKSGRIVVGEAAGHVHDVDQAEATKLYRKLVKASIASAELGIPDDLPEALRTMTDEDLEFDLSDMSAEERREAERRNAQVRDRAEREAALNPPGQPRTLSDLDDALEARARELAREGETLVGAFSRLAGGRGRNHDPEFAALLEERERVARFGAGYQAAAGD